MSEETGCTRESLRVQLAELNRRSRAYTAQTWQVPFAYIGIVGVLVSQLVDKGPGILGASLLFCGLFGTAVLIHLAAMLNGVKRAVGAIRRVEGLLELDQTAEYRPAWHVGAFFGIVGLAAVSSFVACGYYWGRAFA